MRLSRILATVTETKLTIYNTFILANFNYCPIVWMHCGIVNMKKMERLQCRALRFVLNDFTSSFDELLKLSGSTKLTIMRMQTLAIEVYKFINNMSPPYICELLNRHNVPYTMRDNNKLIQKKVNTQQYGIKSFSYTGAKLWNLLPADIKNSPSIREFKANIKSFNFDCIEWC